MEKLWKFEVSMPYGLCVGLFKATIVGTLAKDDITLVSSDPYIVENVPEIGYNPLEYLD